MSNTISIESKNQKFHKAFKLRLYPNQEQITLINKTFGCCRQIYNNRIQEKQEFYIENILPIKKTATKEQITKVYKTFKPSTEKEMKQKFPYMKEVSDRALQSARQNCETAFSNFFKSLKGQRKGRKVGYPQYKSKKENHQSYQEMAICKDRHFDWNAKTIRIPKLGDVKFYEKALPKWWKIVEEFGTCTISKTPSGRYYISILCKLKKDWLEETPKNRKDAIGLDFSPSLCYVDSDNKTGKDFGYVPQKQSNHKKLRKLQRKFARRKTVKDTNSPKKINSKNKEKARAKLAKFEERIANKRRNWIEIETKRLVTTYDKVVVEDLNLQGMSKFLCNAKNMVDTSWGTFVSKLEQKGKAYGCKVIKADKYFPSSKLCSNCGWKYEGLKLSERKWACPECGKTHIRDHNAAINLKNYIPTQHRESTTVDTEYVKRLAQDALMSNTVEEAVTVIGDNTANTPKSL